ncbi:MAG: hypothetical protein ACYTHJ_06370 [Planctomycetota bacterium]
MSPILAVTTPFSEAIRQATTTGRYGNTLADGSRRPDQPRRTGTATPADTKANPRRLAPGGDFGRLNKRRRLNNASLISTLPGGG